MVPGFEGDGTKGRKFACRRSRNSRFKSDKTEEMVKTATQAKAIFEKHGAEFLRMSRFHTGMWAGEWLIVTRYASWEVYGKTQEKVANDP
jgi:hypothetical protein